jgi:hypothetical protein
MAQITLNSSGVASNGSLLLQSNGTTTAVTIDTSQNVGVGTTSPAQSWTGGSARVAQLQGGSGQITVLRINESSATGGDLQLVSSSSSEVAVYNFANGAMRFGTNSAERARITPGGYFKASNFGSYANSTGSFYEFLSDVDDSNIRIHSTNASFASRIVLLNATRAATSAYSFLLGYSGNVDDLEFNLRGDGNAYADGTWNNNGADYAEYFESVNGQELPVGATVVLDGNKVREATNQDSVSAIMGVVRPKEPSKASMVVGNTAWNKWANKYLTDDFDRYIMEDHDVLEWTDEESKLQTYESHNIPAGVTVPDDAVIKTHDEKGNKFQHYKLNPAWNPDAEYVNRENRPEWNIIGLLGQVKILKGQPVGDRWIKMQNISETVEEWFVK